ncbi:transmembrane reductase CYB561D2-like [Neodiprion pinetum]|uniref:ascorbate ferrireductase (transmembrane) n=1 Tax=Neodiprion lecontei TaxID=441921 RepID=A0A6J0BCJ5_NEOLC|nr:transmembrane reductase CYB561D2 [Neodiprion lecontei]XP_046431703.1 transmembrane reductase CYB561D2-like [Neodiprion fabricii]XP_046488314.1 transmembrane reductase CYB561D2-like [Neodiprion pinetum]XP_046625386.1 transmembrane reductase CYB561D2-like [Neodiprion virginianus]
MTAEKGCINWLAIGFSCIVHLLFLIPAVYIVVLCAQLDYSLFIWHPACFTVGCCFLMTEAVLGVSGEAVLVKLMSRPGRIRLHWVLHILGLGLLAVGLGTVVANKMNHGSHHFKSDHARVGLAGPILSVIVTLNGVLCLNTEACFGKVSLVARKVIHSCLGIITMALLLAGQITGVYKGWWPGTETGRDLTVAAYIAGGVLLCAKPLYTTLLRMRTAICS